MKTHLNIGLNIRNWRRLKDIKQESLAEKIGIDKTTLSHIENCKTDVSISSLQKIANAIGISLEKLLFVDPSNYVTEFKEKQINIQEVVFPVQEMGSNHQSKEHLIQVIQLLEEQIKVKDSQIIFLQSLVQGNKDS